MASVSDLVATVAMLIDFNTFQLERGRELPLGAKRLYTKAYLINYIL